MGLAQPKLAKRAKAGGARRDRTADLIIANDALSQLSYGPVPAALIEWQSKWRLAIGCIYNPRHSQVKNGENRRLSADFPGRWSDSDIRTVSAEAILRMSKSRDQRQEIDAGGAWI
jgi:hypothetical protein